MDFSFILILVLAAGAMFLMTNRTRKQQREAQNFRSLLAPGQEVMTGSGMFGTIVEVDEEADIITIESTPGVQSRWLRAAIAKRVDEPVEETEEGDLEATGDEATTSAYGSAASISSGTSDGAEDVVVPDDLSGLSDDAGKGDERDGSGRRDEGTDSTK
ncbi:preprotein translocase subunit YajC [Cellulosimicrobium arenosum]|uniref:Preprotein translocase subunit YajC n=1 Tax=Cellulosimicrobium arenosum TaxID=2708133 RepID=A0A927G6U0_9MICO|nr:preprotein translocase subunit YajC [Cellulosimicrobium arenosum]MBD8077912.1 preprotein translocase subunit YajC [Cellulosimicrobium arenosum]